MATRFNPLEGLVVGGTRTEPTYTRRLAPPIPPARRAPSRILPEVRMQQIAPRRIEATTSAALAPRRRAIPKTITPAVPPPTPRVRIAPSIKPRVAHRPPPPPMPAPIARVIPAPAAVITPPVVEAIPMIENGFSEAGGRPGDNRPFLGGLIRGIGSIAGALPIPGAGIIKGITSAIAGGPPEPVSTAVIPQTFAPQKPVTEALPGNFGGGYGGNGGRRCPAGTYTTPQGTCASPQSGYGITQFQGQAINGLYGAAYAPTERLTSIAVCPPGHVLGKDDLCYDSLANRKRKYPRGRRPLLTGGDLNAIRKSSSAARKMQNTRSNLVAMGMLKPIPKRRRRK